MNPVSILAFGLPGGIEWVIVLVIGLLLFGRRLPEIMRGLGGGVREFRKGIEGAAEEAQREDPKKRVDSQPSKVASEEKVVEKDGAKS